MSFNFDRFPGYIKVIFSILNSENVGQFHLKITKLKNCEFAKFKTNFIEL